MLPLYLLLLVMHACKNSEHPSLVLFSPVPVEHSHVDFKSTFTNNPDDITGFETGAGVSTADINNDGLPDIMFAGGRDTTRLFLNKGNLVFEDITSSSGIFDGIHKGRTDAAIFVDINGDGWLDIYILKYGIEGNQEGTIFSDYGSNLLFINQKNLTFKEQSKEYGLDIVGFKVGVNFFDFDNDGDLDVIMLNNPDPGNSFDFNYYTTPSKIKVLNNRLFENTGNYFEDITEKSGILNERCVGQSVSIADVNNDGWLDIYIANDFFGKDYLYINNGNKTFTDKQQEFLPKTAMSSMGSDFGDINNDGWLDLFTCEMLPEDAVRRKMNIVPFSSEVYNYMVAHKIAQYPRNMLQLNKSGKSFSDIGFMAGVEATEWSWGCLFADVNNDGLDDLFVANGIKRDLTNMDFVRTNYGNDYQRMADPNYKVRLREAYTNVPSVKTPNYIFKNNGDLTFSKMNEQWGLNQAVHSRGAAYADLDSDGDLDFLINNIDTVAFMYENKENEILKRNFLKIKLEGAKQNTSGFGGRVYIYKNGKMQMKQLSCVRGFMSSPEPLLYFGLDSIVVVDSIKVIWLGGNSETKVAVKANQILVFKEKDAVVSTSKEIPKAQTTFLKDETNSLLSQPIVHKDSNYSDFKNYRLFHRMFSKELPAIAVTDINRDGREDFHILNSWKDKSTTAYLQQPDGKFRPSNQKGESLVFSNFSKHITCMAPSDYDNDKDVDWFINDRIDYDHYPKPAGNYLLRNDKGTLNDVTDSIAPGLRNCGMVTAAVWVDFNKDSLLDLIVVGEWMPVTIFENRDGKLIKIESDNGLQYTEGWWNSITAGDFDKDGDIDFVAGNLGLNSVFKASKKEPVTIYAGDFDGNGTNDPIVFHYISGKNVPFVNRDLFCEQMPVYNNKFYTFENFAKANFNDILTLEQQSSSYQLKATVMASCYLENLGNGKYAVHPLPNEAQVAPVYGIQPADVNGDGNLDIVLAGNSFSNHYEYGNYDALGGLVLLGDGKGNFKATSDEVSGFNIKGDAKNVVKIFDKALNTNLFLAPQNNDALKIFMLNTKSK